MTSSREILGALKKNNEMELAVKGRTTGKIIVRPVWFVLSKDEKSIFLIPMNGRKTQWYLNVKKEPMVTIKVGKHDFTSKIVEVGERQFKEVFSLFAARYGERDMEEYYPRLEVALEVPLPASS
jgi:hypothetical protein